MDRKHAEKLVASRGGYSDLLLAAAVAMPHQDKELVEALLTLAPPENVKPNDEYIENFVKGYIECALWSSTICLGVEEDKLTEEQKKLEGHSFDDAGYDESSLDPKTLESMRKDCVEFIELCKIDLMLCKMIDGNDASQAGHDFWLTRNRHGAGFWDRGLGDKGKRLTDAAHNEGEVDLMLGDDDKIHSN